MANSWSELAIDKPCALQYNLYQDSATFGVAQYGYTG